jgi:hypothetical protein
VIEQPSAWETLVLGVMFLVAVLLLLVGALLMFYVRNSER